MIATEKTRETHQRNMSLKQDTLVGAWLKLVPDILNIKTLYYKKLREKLLLYFILEPLGICHNCGGCR